MVQEPTHGSPLSAGCRALSLATLRAPGAFGGATCLFVGWRFGSSQRRRPRSIVGLDPGPHALGRFHTKARLPPQQNKGFSHTKVGWLLQLALQTSGGLWRQARQHQLGLRELVGTL